MTVLGKILVIVNLVFSVVTGALIVMVFVTRTNWREGVEQWKNRAQVHLADKQAVEKEMEDQKAALGKEIEQLKGEMVGLTNQIQGLNIRLQNETGLKDQLQSRVAIAEANVQKATAEADARKLEVQKYQDQLNAAQQRMVQLEDQNKKFRDQAVAATIEQKAEQERNRRLLAQMESMTPAPGGGAERPGGTRVAAKPPAEDVDGRVIESDAQANLVTVSLGSDAGVTAGTTLEVFRYDPRPEYLGQLQIVDARPHQAVGRPVAPLRANRIRAGDKVASRIR